MNRRNSVGAAIALTTGIVIASYLWNRKKTKKIIQLQNIHPISDPDYYFHLYLDTEQNDIKGMFSGVKYLILTGKKEDATEICDYYQKEFYGNTEPSKPIAKDDRYRLHLCGPLLIASTGIGGSSISILLQEITKLLSRAEADLQGYIVIDRSFSSVLSKDSVVICGEAVGDDLTNRTNVCVLGESKTRNIVFSSELANDIYSAHKRQNDHLKHDVRLGKAMGAQSVMKSMGLSPFAPATEEEKLEFRNTLKAQNILVINEVAHILGAFCGYLNIDCVLLSVIEKSLSKNGSSIEVVPTSIQILLEVLTPHLRTTCSGDLTSAI